jgi:hypothetical protein
MKAISIRQPWAALIVAGIKDIENRKWSTKHRGKILIHASKKVDKSGFKMMKEMGIPEIIVSSMINYSGGIIGEVELTDCVEKSDSEWFEGPYGFVLKNAKVLPFRSCKGKLGVFNIDILKNWPNIFTVLMKT